MWGAVSRGCSLVWGGCLVEAVSCGDGLAWCSPGSPSEVGPGRGVEAGVEPRSTISCCVYLGKCLQSAPCGACFLGPREDDVSEQHAHTQHPHLSADGPTSQTHPVTEARGTSRSAPARGPAGALVRARP